MHSPLSLFVLLFFCTAFFYSQREKSGKNKSKLTNHNIDDILHHDDLPHGFTG